MQKKDWISLVSTTLLCSLETFVASGLARTRVLTSSAAVALLEPGGFSRGRNSSRSLTLLVLAS